MTSKYLPSVGVGLVMMLVGSMARAKPGEGLLVTASPSRDVYVLGDVVTIDVVVSNQSEEALLLTCDDSVRDGPIYVELADGKGKKWLKYFGPWPIIDGSAGRLQPGQKCRTKVEMLVNQPLGDNIPREYPFDRAGTYTLRVIVQGTSGSAESDAFVVRIVDPKTPEDVAFWKLLRSNRDYGAFVQKGGCPSEVPKCNRILRDAADFASRFPGSRRASLLEERRKEHEKKLRDRRAMGIK